jgi:hypothetical protein
MQTNTVAPQSLNMKDFSITDMKKFPAIIVCMHNVKEREN